MIPVRGDTITGRNRSLIRPGKVGSKVTIEYRMTAATIEVKDPKPKDAKKK